MSWDASVTLTGVVFASVFVVLVKNCYNIIVQRNRDIPDQPVDNINVLNRLDNPCIEVVQNSFDICSICLEAYEFKVVTNCGHGFCGYCFTSYWHVGNFVRAVSCPMCRSNVHQLTKIFSEDEKLMTTDIKCKIDDEIDCFNRLYTTSPRSWTQQFLDMPIILRHGFRHILDDVNTINIIHRLRITVLTVIVVGYCLSPFDVFPEAGFGVLSILDDILILATFITYLTIFLQRTIGGGGGNNA